MLFCLAVVKGICQRVFAAVNRIACRLRSKESVFLNTCNDLVARLICTILHILGQVTARICTGSSRFLQLTVSTPFGGSVLKVKQNFRALAKSYGNGGGGKV